MHPNSRRQATPTAGSRAPPAPTWRPAPASRGADTIASPASTDRRPRRSRRRRSVSVGNTSTSPRRGSCTPAQQAAPNPAAAAHHPARGEGDRRGLVGRAVVDHQQLTPAGTRRARWAAPPTRSARQNHRDRDGSSPGRRCRCRHIARERYQLACPADGQAARVISAPCFIDTAADAGRSAWPIATHREPLLTVPPWRTPPPHVYQNPGCAARGLVELPSAAQPSTLVSTGRVWGCCRSWIRHRVRCASIAMWRRQLGDADRRVMPGESSRPRPT